MFHPLTFTSIMAITLSTMSAAAAAARTTVHRLPATTSRSAFGYFASPPGSWRHYGLESSVGMYKSGLLPSSSRTSSLLPSPSTLCMANRDFGNNKSSTKNNRSNTSTISVENPDNKNNNSKQGGNNKTTNKKESNKDQKTKKTKSNTGRLRLLPSLQPSTEILSRCLRQAHNEIKEDTSINNARRRTQKRGAQTIDLLSQKLCQPLKTTVETYKREFKHMHPFEKVVMELTVQSRQKKDGLTLSTLLEDIHEGRKELLQLSKDWISKIKSTQTAKEAFEYTEEAREVLGKVFLDLIDEPWSGIMELQKSLRNVPIVRLDCPAVVLVGAPNVGKSSIVRAISSGTPEVNNYPFTTRGMTLGHVQVFWESDQDVAAGNVAGVSIPSEKQLVQESLVRLGVKTRRMKEKELLNEFSKEEVDDDENDDDDDNWEEYDDDETTDMKISKTITATISTKSYPISQLCQIMDSPGLLRREISETRNEMEALTLAAMAHLPTAVMYVMDLSGGAGDRCSSVEDQLVLRKEVRERFPRRPWIDVISKVDLGIIDGAEERLKQILETEQKERLQQRGGSAGDVIDDSQFYINLSIKEGQGVDELRQEVMRMLGEVRVVLDAMAAMDERSARPV